VRWLPTGEIDCLGRIDHQVKLHGVRIELGEIEAVLLQHESVTATAVILDTETAGKEQLVAYVVPAKAELPVDDLKKFLASKLPPYMIPTIFVPLEHIPVTVAGKVDKKALPSPEIARRRKKYVAPRTPVEETITGLFIEVLQTDRVGVQDDLFELGASSLQAAMVSTFIQDKFNIRVPDTVIFDHRTVEQLTVVVEATLSNQAVEA
jgi:acyl carrier protein